MKRCHTSPGATCSTRCVPSSNVTWTSSGEREVATALHQHLAACLRVRALAPPPDGRRACRPPRRTSPGPAACARTQRSSVTASSSPAVAAEQRVAERTEVAPAHLRGDREEVVRPGMAVGPALGVGAHHPAEHLRPDLPLQHREDGGRPAVGAAGDVARALEPPPRPDDRRLEARSGRSGRAALDRDRGAQERRERHRVPGGGSWARSQRSRYRLEDLRGGPGVDPLVEPGLLELVGGEHPLPPAVGRPRESPPPRRSVSRGLPGRCGEDGEERRVLHPARVEVRSDGRRDQGEVGIGVGQPVPAAVLEGGPGGGERPARRWPARPRAPAR